jgi:hypothetical protein
MECGEPVSDAQNAGLILGANVLPDAYLHTQFVDLVEKNGVSGYYYIYPNSIKGVMLHQANYSGEATAKKVWTPILEKMSSYPDMSKASISISEYPTYKAYFDARFGAIDKPMNMEKPAPAPWETAGRKRTLAPRHGPGMESGAPEPNAIVNLDSRLLGAAHFAHPNLTSILKAAAPFAIGGTSAVIQGHLVSGGKAHHPDDDSAFSPPRFRSNIFSPPKLLCMLTVL